MRKDGADPWGAAPSSNRKILKNLEHAYFCIKLVDRTSNLYILELPGINGIMNLKKYVWGENMTKEQTIRWLRNYIKAEKAYLSRISYTEDCKKELKKCEQKPEVDPESGVFGMIIEILLWTIIGTLILGVICAVCWCVFLFFELIVTDYKNNFLTVELKSAQFIKFWVRPVVYVMKGDAENPTVIQGILSFFTFSLIPAFVLSIVLGVHDKITTPKKNKLELAAHAERLKKIPRLEERVREAEKKQNIAQQELENLEKQNVVPKKYLTWAQELLGYLEDCRADSLKEAINLMEFEWNQEERLHELKRHNKRMEETYARHAAAMERSADASERAAEAAEEDAFWSKGSTFLIANEIDKLKKK